MKHTGNNVTRRRYRSASAAAVLLGLLILAGAPCAAESTAETTEPAISVVDMKGRTVTLDRPAERVIALSAADCEILYAIGAEELLVGRGEYCDYPAEVLDIPAVASGANTNLEQIMALDPDILLMSEMSQTVEQVEQLEASGIRVVVSESNEIDGVYQAIDAIGTLVGKEAEAEALISGMQETFAVLSEQSAGDGSESIYFEVSPLEYGLWTAGSGTFMNEVAEMLGMKNCFGDVEGWAAISEEQVLERNPDYIVTISMYFGDGPTPTEEILGRTGWDHVTAVKNGRILNLQNNELSRPGPRLADGAQQLYDFLFESKEESQDVA